MCVHSEQGRERRRWGVDISLLIPELVWSFHSCQSCVLLICPLCLTLCSSATILPLFFQHVFSFWFLFIISNVICPDSGKHEYLNPCCSIVTFMSLIIIIYAVKLRVTVAVDYLLVMDSVVTVNPLPTSFGECIHVILNWPNASVLRCDAWRCVFCLSPKISLFILIMICASVTLVSVLFH